MIKKAGQARRLSCSRRGSFRPCGCADICLCGTQDREKRTEQRGSYVNIPGDEEPGTQEEQNPQDNGQSEQQAADESAEDSQAAQAEPREITLDDYKNLYTEILKQAEEPKKAMVTVIGSKKDEDWFQTPYETRYQPDCCG